MRRLVFLLPVIVLLTACSSKTYMHRSNTGNYEYIITNTGTTADPVVTGGVFYHDVKSPIKAGAVRTKEQLLAKLNTDGSFSFTVKAGKYRFTALAITYSICETKGIKLKNGDSLNIRFYLNDSNETIHDLSDPQN